MAPNRRSIWLEGQPSSEEELVRDGAPGTRPASPGCQANPMGNADRARNRRQAGGGTGKGKSNMAIAESRPVVPAVLYDVDEAAEALRLSRSVLYELIRSGRLRTVKQGRRRLVPVSALAEYVDSLGRQT